MATSFITNASMLLMALVSFIMRSFISVLRSLCCVLSLTPYCLSSCNYMSRPNFSFCWPPKQRFVFCTSFWFVSLSTLSPSNSLAMSSIALVWSSRCLFIFARATSWSAVSFVIAWSSFSLSLSLRSIQSSLNEISFLSSSASASRASYFYLSFLRVFMHYSTLISPLLRRLDMYYSDTRRRFLRFVASWVIHFTYSTKSWVSPARAFWLMTLIRSFPLNWA